MNTRTCKADEQGELGRMGDEKILETAPEPLSLFLEDSKVVLPWRGFTTP